jgi:hypothetical protein
MDKHIWVGQWMDSHIFKQSKEMVQYMNFKMLHNMYEPSQRNWIIWKSVKINKMKKMKKNIPLISFFIHLSTLQNLTKKTLHKLSFEEVDC